ncbi:MAG TPA: NUDIX domain-containing protein [Candidatus Saccharimonadales bacterium]|jgi:8-oxo-dGTP pyrophosphatase MutT (NUDIX family)|nr:NUDIX domain-containing protein [Candidatus Saccharimonadales bacterium]
MGWQDRHTVIPAVYLMLRRGDQVHLMRRYNTGYQDGMYSLPAGHLDGGETARAAMVREAKEEAGITVAPDDLKLVHTMHRLAEERSHERMDLFFETTVWQGEPQVMEPDKCDDVQWFDTAKLPENTVAVVAQALRCVAAHEPYSESGF